MNYNKIDQFIEYVIKQNSLSVFLTIRTKTWYDTKYEKNEKNNLIIKNEISKIKSIIEETKLKFFYIIVVELGKNNKPHYHIIISYKNIIGFNKEFTYNIKNYFIDKLGEIDIQIDFIDTFINYKNKIKYILKENESLKFLIIKDNNLSKYVDIFKTILTVEDNSLDKYHYIGSFSKINNEYDEYTIINMLNFFFLYKNLHFCKDTIVKKIQNTIMSYENYIKIENLTEGLIKIFNELLNEFPLQLNNIDIYSLKIKYFPKVEQMLKSTTQILINKIELKFNIVEFTDGIYIINKNKFISKKELENKEFKNIGTIKYYKKTFKHLKIPNEWKRLIEETIGNKKKADELFYYYATIFNQNDDLLGKERIMYIKGESSTGKTTLLTKIIYNFFGENNIGTITSNSNFALESLLEKEVAIIDEAEHLKWNNGILLRITERENNQQVERKYKKATVLKSIRLLLLSNNEIKIKNNSVKNAVYKRLKMFEFTKQLTGNVNEYKKIINIILKEEINIIIFCNDLFFKKYIYKDNIKPKIRNKKITEKLIHFENLYK